MTGRFIVVENSGMIGETDICTFASQAEAWAFVRSAYSDDERDHLSGSCLFPDVAYERNGERTYDI